VDCLVQVGRAAGVERRAEKLAADLRRRLDSVRDAVAGLPRPTTFALEWSDPPFNAGHWVPDMIEAAGGEPVLAARRTPSVRVGWAEIAQAAPEVVLFIPCGYNLDQACAEADTLLERTELQRATMFLAADASAYFSRPGPRVVDGVEALATALHPEADLSRGSSVLRQLR
jgi:iron complex transport system substrate-binding protein